MSDFESIKQSLLEAIEIEKGNIPIIEKNGFPAPMFTVSSETEFLVSDKINN